MGDYMNEFDADVYKHRVAAWAACRAAAGVPAQFSVQQGSNWLRGGLAEKEFVVSLNKDMSSICSCEQFDAWHRGRVIDLQKRSTDLLQKNVSYGIGAKLLNVYLKIFFLHEISGPDIGGWFSYVHPPLDSTLLKRFRKMEGPGNPKINTLPRAFMKFTKEEYEDTIRVMRQFAKEHGQPLWKIECYWPGYHE